ncbi:hypothetical protein U9M48_008098 [Paspalum notatum var. saurae]|uniref:Uncharacterized protein n=1 Tax=Paspalum notatum var. saurae TaxID=547442 RepID=A0AAQ3SNF6_PASNO
MSMSPTSPRQPGGGARSAAAFKVHRDSHSIHKAAAATSPPSSSSTNSSVSSPSNAAISSTSHQPALRHKPPAAPRPQQQQQHKPKLTGLDGPGARGALHHQAAAPRANNGAVQQQADESSSSSSESCANANAHAHAAGPPPPYADSQLMPPPPPAPAPLDAHFVAPDIPLFAPDASDHQLQQFCASRGIYGQFPPADALGLGGPVVTANVNAAASNGAIFAPSMVEAMKTFPHYN